MNEKFDNTFSNTIVVIVGTIVRTLERSIVTFWDGLRSTTVHGTPSLLGFVAAISPVLTPIPIAIMTATSLTQFMRWTPFQSTIMAITIECIGFVLWVYTTQSFMKDGWQGTTTQFIFSGAVGVYQLVLILINVGLAVNDGARTTTALILLLVSLFPAMASVAFGYTDTQSKAILEAERKAAAEQKERERQEKREDRLRDRELKLKYAAESERLKLKKDPFRNK